MKKKLSLNEIKVKSFVTTELIIGGAQSQSQQPICSGIQECTTGITARKCESINAGCLTILC